ncbi:hypothetical protein [Streptomyces sp. NPDC004296]|uniref:hypothetical protein n=1 Tax=Streptomyces sp. NPDC004296 TaxID=3364697 RepID=UPI0036AC719A
MAFGANRVIGELSTAISDAQTAITDAISNAQSAITNALDRSLAGIRATVESTLGAAQNARDTAVHTHARTDAVHSELQSLRNDIQRLQPATPRPTSTRSSPNSPYSAAPSKPFAPTPTTGPATTAHP